MSTSYSLVQLTCTFLIPEPARPDQNFDAYAHLVLLAGLFPFLASCIQTIIVDFTFYIKTNLFILPHIVFFSCILASSSKERSIFFFLPLPPSGIFLSLFTKPSKLSTLYQSLFCQDLTNLSGLLIFLLTPVFSRSKIHSIKSDDEEQSEPNAFQRAGGR